MTNKIDLFLILYITRLYWHSKFDEITASFENASYQNKLLINNKIRFFLFFDKEKIIYKKHNEI